MMFRIFILLLAVGAVLSDVYLHNPCGSNNRLNEASANRRNANRAFDSQNNNRGGYNVGDATNVKAQTESKQYQMKYFQSGPTRGQTSLTLEWTNQHGCGGNEDTDPHKMNCNIVFQYMCQKDGLVANNKDRLRDGTNTNRQDYARINLKETAQNSRKRDNVKDDRVLQETFDWYDKCYGRERNQGLFTADQKLKKNGLGYSSAIHTRQNPNGNRRGYECPEERDYYPYWHPTPWKDIAVLAVNNTVCPYYTTSSHNVQPYHECVEYFSANVRKPYSRWNNEEDCTKNNGVWTEFTNYLEKAQKFTNKAACERASTSSIKYIWALPLDARDGKTKECLVALSKPDCVQSPWSRSNHLGNGRDGQANNYTWTLPYFPSGDIMNCVVRVRYNISTDDYDPYNTTSSHNNNILKGVMSPVQQNPYVEIGAGHSPLRLAINTAQFGRTFQDRSHKFVLRPRPDDIKDAQIYNLNVRGKRGNIVQVYPAVEYDFFPTNLNIQANDLVHIQWTGSNSHNNGAPAGDGQAGDAGEGTRGTDRHNMVHIQDLRENYPLPFEKSEMWKNAEIKWIYHSDKTLTPSDLAVSMASSGYYKCIKKIKCGAESSEQKTKLNNLLNNAPASYEGAVLKFKKGTYHYMCTRNNNFTNRSQKGSIFVR